MRPARVVGLALALLAGASLLTACNGPGINVDDVTLIPSARAGGRAASAATAAVNGAARSQSSVREFLVPSGRAGVLRVSFDSSRRYDTCTLDLAGRASLPVHELGDGYHGDTDGANPYYYVEVPTDSLPLGASVRASLRCFRDAGASDTDEFIVTVDDRSDIRVNTQDLQFGSVQAGTRTGPVVLVVTNAGSRALSIGSSVFGTDMRSFSTDDDSCGPGNSVKPGTRCQIKVYFQPGSAGPKSAYLTLTAGGATSPLRVSLTGTGTPPPLPAFSASPTSVSFGDVNVGSSSARQWVNITNTGSVTMSIERITLVGADPLSFSYNPACTDVLRPGSQCGVYVQFSARVTGTTTANLSITDNAPGSPHNVPLSGTGLPGPTPYGPP